MVQGQPMSRTRRRLASVAAVALLAVVAAACGSSRRAVPPASTQADRFLFERGEENIRARKWIQAREYFRQIVENYPQSTFRPDAKLYVGDTYIGEKTAESLLLAVNEFREFLTFYPTSPRADYAQYRLGASYAAQMLAPERDQTVTRDAVKEYQLFLDRYPNSRYAPEVTKALREARDRLSEASYRVGVFYFRVKWWPGAADRFREVLKNDPGFTRRDGVYFHLGETLLQQQKKAEALPYFQRLVDEFQQSEYLDAARRRLSELASATPSSGR